MREGRRLFPVLPRTPPYTAYTILGNTVAEDVAKQNDKLPHPMETRREMLPDGDPTLPPKPVVTEDPVSTIGLFVTIYLNTLHFTANCIHASKSHKTRPETSSFP